MCSTSRVLHKITLASQAAAENLLGHQMVFCRAPATLPVGSGPVVGVARLSLQFSGPLTHILQTPAHCVMKIPAVFQF